MLKNTILIFVFSSLFGCSTSPHVSVDNAYSKAFKGVIKENPILLLPVKMAIKEFNKADAIVSESVVRQLEFHGWSVVTLNRAVYDQKWSEIVKEIGGIYSPATGRLNTDKYYDAIVKFTKIISREKIYSAILFPSFELKKAELKGKHAYWDGVRRKKIVKGTSDENMRWSGNTRGLSLKIWAFDSAGEWLFTSYGGLVLPFYTSMYNSREESKLRLDMFDNSKNIESGVNVALLPIINKDRKK